MNQSVALPATVDVFMVRRGEVNRVNCYINNLCAVVGAHRHVCLAADKKHERGQ